MENEKQYEKLTLKMAKNLAAPHTWAASLMPSAFAAVFCWLFGLDLGLLRALALIAACVLMQSSVNTLNDYFDYVKGTDSKDDTLEAFDAVLVYNSINPKSALKLGIGFLAAAAVLGTAAAWGRGITAFVIGILGGLCVIFYSGGKKPISYLPIGELVSGFVMGALIPVAIVSIAAGRLGKECLVVFIDSLPFVIGISMIMMTNNTCDIEKDIAADRMTFPVRAGREKTKKIYGFLAKLWLGLIMMLSVMTLGVNGIITVIFTWFISRKTFRFLWTSPLTQENRIAQMRGILSANKTGNGIYILFYFLAAVSVNISSILK